MEAEDYSLRITNHNLFYLLFFAFLIRILQCIALRVNSNKPARRCLERQLLLLLRLGGGGGPATSSSFSFGALAAPARAYVTGRRPPAANGAAGDERAAQQLSCIYAENVSRVAPSRSPAADALTRRRRAAAADAAVHAARTVEFCLEERKFKKYVAPKFYVDASLRSRDRRYRRCYRRVLRATNSRKIGARTQIGCCVVGIDRSFRERRARLDLSLEISQSRR